MVIFHSYVSSPEGTPFFTQKSVSQNIPVAMDALVYWKPNDQPQVDQEWVKNNPRYRGFTLWSLTARHGIDGPNRNRWFTWVYRS